MKPPQTSCSQELDSFGGTKPQRRPRWPLGAGVALMMLGVVLAVLLHRVPNLWVPADGPAAPDQQRMVAAVARIVGDGQPRLVGTPAAAAGRERIVELFAEAGVALEPHEVHLARSRAGELHLTNLVGRVPGTDASAGTIAVAAHSDSVRVSPGAGDDASGVAAVLEVAYMLRDHPPRHDVVILITDGEEAGLLGAEAFMRLHPWAAEIRGVVNLDARGASGPAYVFELGPDTRRLVGQMRRHMPGARSTSLAAWVYEQMPTLTDFTIFKREGVTGYNVAFIGDYPAYHSPMDTPERLRADTLHHMGHAARALVRALDEMRVSPGADAGPIEGDGAGVAAGSSEAPALTIEQAQPANATLIALSSDRMAWTDLAGVTIVGWPESLGPVMACLAALLVLVPAARFGATSAPAVRAVGLSVGLLLACMAVSYGLGWGTQAGAKAAQVSMRTAPDRTLALTVLLWCAVSVVLAVATVVLARRWRCPETAWFAGVWIVWSTLAVASAFLMPAVTPMLAMPVAAAGAGAVAMWLVGSDRPGGWPRAWRMVVGGSLAGAGATALVWVPWEPAFLDALGLDLAPVTAVRALIALSPLVPLAALAWPHFGGSMQEAPSPRSELSVS